MQSLVKLEVDVYDCQRRHNHAQSLEPSAHNVYRRRTNKQADKTREVSSVSAIGVREMLRLVRQIDPEPDHFRIRDIYNDRQKIRQERLGGLTPTQAFVRHLQVSDLPHRIKFDDENRVCAVLWTYPWCREMWKKYPGFWASAIRTRPTGLAYTFSKSPELLTKSPLLILCLALMTGNARNNFDGLLASLRSFVKKFTCHVHMLRSLTRMQRSGRR